MKSSKIIWLQIGYKIENNYLGDIEEEKIDLNNDNKNILDNNEEIVNNQINQETKFNSSIICTKCKSQIPIDRKSVV